MLFPTSDNKNQNIVYLIARIDALEQALNLQQFHHEQTFQTLNEFTQAIRNINRGCLEKGINVCDKSILEAIDKFMKEGSERLFGPPCKFCNGTGKEPKAP